VLHRYLQPEPAVQTEMATVPLACLSSR
jgi:hypothetical protein